MIGLNELFKKARSSFSKEIILRTKIKEAIKNQTGLDLLIENISCKTNTVVLKNISQAARSVIFIKKQAILMEIAGLQTSKTVSDIK